MKNETKTRLIETYVVRRPFDNYKIGDIFKPSGKRNDELIIEYYCDISMEEETQCPKCGEWLARLDLHKKCKGGKSNGET